MNGRGFSHLQRNEVTLPADGVSLPQTGHLQMRRTSYVNRNPGPFMVCNLPVLPSSGKIHLVTSPTTF
jgi:hypothetical protein